MIVFSKKLPNDILKNFKSIYLKKSPGGGKFNFSYSLKSEHSDFFILAFFVITIFFVSIKDKTQYNFSFYYLILFFVTSYILFRLFQVLKNYYLIKKGFIYLDRYYFIKYEKKFIEYFPIVKYYKYEIDQNNNELKIYTVDDVFSFKFNETNSEKVIDFLNKLQNYFKLSFHNLKIDKSFYSNSIYFSHNGIFSIKDFIKDNKKILIFSFSLTLIFYIFFPYYIDYNAFLKAKKINTATSYRDYLNEPRNSLFREKAILNIKKIYDVNIEKYKKMANSENTRFIVLLLEYLRDNNLYSVPFIFHAKNNIKLVKPPFKYSKIFSPLESFSPKKISYFENNVRTNIKRLFGSIFPADILNITTSSISPRNPLFLVNYSYENMNGFYYPIDQKKLPISKRTYYYGIKINWEIDIIIPSIKTRPVYSFSFSSQPAPQFTSENKDPDNVYENMIRSAFQDLQIKFKNKFFE